jgi:polysaccharide export outer membrane protein
MVMSLASLALATSLAAQGSNPRANAAAPAVPPPAVPPVLVADEYRIGPEDILDIVVWGQVELTRTVQVRPDGRISLPLVNDVRAADMTPMELKAAISKSLEQSEFIRNAEVSVMVREVNSTRVGVVGQVRASGRFPLRSRMTVLDALAMAGGFTDFARKDKIRVQRRDGTVIDLPYERLLDESDPRANILLQAGDIIVVR